MAKNRVPSDRPTKKKDGFFTRPRQKFKANKTDQSKKNFGHTKRENNSQYSAGDSFRPSASGSGDFFVRPSDNVVTRKFAAKKSLGTAGFKQESNSLGKRCIQLPNQHAANYSESHDAVQQEKKPFDKKQYRLKKYSKKYKLEQWEQKRKKAILQGYYRNLKDDEPKLDVTSIYQRYKDEIESEGDNVDHKVDEENENNLNASINASTSKEEPAAPKSSKAKKNRAFKKAHIEFQRIRDEKQKEREEKLKKKAERKEALQAYKQKKSEKFKKLSRKTKRGQPIMKERMEMLLEKIQNSMK